MAGSHHHSTPTHSSLLPGWARGGVEGGHLPTVSTQHMAHIPGHSRLFVSPCPGRKT